MNSHLQIKEGEETSLTHSPTPIINKHRSMIVDSFVPLLLGKEKRRDRTFNPQTSSIENHFSTPEAKNLFSFSLLHGLLADNMSDASCKQTVTQCQDDFQRSPWVKKEVIMAS